MPRLVTALTAALAAAAVACGGGPSSRATTTASGANPSASAPAAGSAAQDAGLGTVTFPNSGAASAQAAFLRGVTWLHNFGYEDAIDAFQAAQQADPRFLLAYWGEALAYSQPLWFGEQPDKGRAVLRRLADSAQARAALAPTPRERGFLRAVEALWGEGDRPTRAQAHADAMADLAAEFSDDDEVLVFRALALLGTLPRGDASLPRREEAGRLAERVLRRNPRHPGAAHLVLHAYDHRALAARALPAAHAYAGLAPASSHALHMPAHAYVQLGHWSEAAASDQASWEASVAWSARRRQPVTTHDFHSLVWWHYELTQLGRFGRADEVAEAVDRALAIATERDVIGGHHYGDSNIGRGSGPAALRNDKGSMRARRVLETEQWEMLAGQASFDNLDELYVLAVSALRLGDAPRARAAYQELEKAAGPSMDAGLREQAAIMVLEVEAEAAVIDGTPAVARSKLDAAVALQRRMPVPIGRPYPVKGADELYGEVLLQLGRPAEAVRWFEEALVRTPNRSRAVLGLARALTRSGQAAEGRKAYARFLDNWKTADEGRPELVEARAAVAGTR